MVEAKQTSQIADHSLQTTPETVSEDREILDRILSFRASAAEAERWYKAQDPLPERDVKMMADIYQRQPGRKRIATEMMARKDHLIQRAKLTNRFPAPRWLMLLRPAPRNRCYWL